MTKNTRNPLDPRTLSETWQLPVLDSITTPPAAPNDGDRYRIIAAATGVWAGKENQIAIWNEETQNWLFETYTEGTVLYDIDANDYRYVKPDGSWEQFDKIPLAISDVTGLQAALDDLENNKAAITHAASHEEGGSDEIVGTLAAVAKINVEKDGAGTITTHTINFIEGSNITITVTENAGKTDVTIQSTGGASDEFLDSLFRVIGNGDNTKKVALDVDTLITAEQTRTLKVQDSDGTIAILEGNQVFTALVQALTMIATDSITSAKLVLTDLAADPSNNGEIQRNGTEIRAKSNGFVGKILVNNQNDTVTIDGVDMTLKEAFLL